MDLTSGQKALVRDRDRLPEEPLPMRAVTWHGRADVRVDTVPDPTIQDPTDVVVEVTSSGICGSDLHLIEVMAPFMTVGDVMGHEPMGVVREVGPEVTAVKPGDRVVVPFNISCGTCWMCSQGLQSQCETTQNREQGFGASLFGYTKLYGQVPGGQAEYLRVPFGNTLPIKVPDGPADDRFVYLSDVLPTSWQAVQYPGLPPGGTVLVLGLGPIGDMASRIATHLGYRVIASDVVPERSAGAARSRCPVSTAAPPIPCRSCGCSTSRSSCAWDRPTCGAGCPTSSRC